jgi:hypothetical protein
MSEVRLKQPPSQGVNGGAQSALQTPPEQTWLAAQALPQLPQFFGSFWTSTHPWSQRIPPEAQAKSHCPEEHTGTAPDGATQTLSQPPQLATSEAGSTQEAPHGISGATQSSEQAPWEHTSPSSQTTPQLPQFFGSFLVSKQATPQRVWPPPQVIPQAPSWQIAS